MEESSIFDFNLLQYLSSKNMANVAHLVRASGCGSEGRGFDPLHSPQNINIVIHGYIFIFEIDGEIEPSK